MAQEQLGICAEENLHSLYLMFNCYDGNEAHIRKVLALLPDLFEELSDQFFESMVSGFVAVGALYWEILYPGNFPKLLKPFIGYEGSHVIPDTPFDLFIQIRSERSDVNFLAGQKVCRMLGNSVELAEQIAGFRFMDGRDLTGFVCNSDNAKGLHRRDVALVSDDDEFNGGSYVHIQRFRHNLSRWEQLSGEEQEAVYGRSKMTNEPKRFSEQLATSHATRTNLINMEGEQVEVLLQSMPYGDMKSNGLYFISCCKTPDNYNLLMQSRVTGGDQGNYDHLLDFTQAETGAAFFAPSKTFLKKRGL